MNDPRRYLLEGIRILQSEDQKNTVPLWVKIIDYSIGGLIFVGWWSFIIYLFIR